MQGNPALYRGTIDALVRIAREEGVVGLYRQAWRWLAACIGQAAGLLACKGQKLQPAIFCKRACALLSAATCTVC